MNENIENNNNGSNRFLAFGIIFALILMGVGSIYLARVFEKRLGSAEKEEHENPLLNKPEEIIEDDKPEIPGVVVYHAETDVEQINVDAANREKQFYKNMEGEKSNLTSKEKGELLKRKDSFAAKRLSFLRQIEEAVTREERNRLIQELKKFCEGDLPEDQEEPQKKDKE